MTLQQAYSTALGRMKEKNAREASRAFDLSLLFEQAFGVSRYRLPLVGGQPADPGKLRLFQELCARYEADEPLQYILGEWEFYGLPFRVGPGVLIPRQDTETLVEVSLSLLKGREAPVFADLCAGSGCIAATLAHQRPDARGFALELSEEALPYLRENLAQNAPHVAILQADVLRPPTLPPLDLVVSNPPYIPLPELETLDPEVRREPRMALAGGEDGYDFYRALPGLYYPLLKPGGAVAFEVGYNQAARVAGLLEQAGFQDIRVTNDLAGIPRVVHATK